jgi:4-hydroxybenzoate polyprenyl transferase
MFGNYYNLARLNRPTGIYLLALPCLIGYFLNADFDFKIPFLFIFGAIIMRSAGCVINDIFDRKFDQKVARTKNRPLANGNLRLFQAFLFLAFLLAFGLVILLQFHIKTVFAGIFSLALVILYPLMKRITFYPQIFLGIVFNFGIILASIEVLGSVNFSSFLLYVAFILWTLIYDTIYAFQDIEDDLKIGVKSSAIAFSQNPKQILAILTIFMAILLILVGFFAKMNIFYYIFAILALIFEFYLVLSCNYKDPKDCLRKFKANVVFALILLIGVMF